MQLANTGCGKQMQKYGKERINGTQTHLKEKSDKTVLVTLTRKFHYKYAYLVNVY